MGILIDPTEYRIDYRSVHAGVEVLRDLNIRGVQIPIPNKKRSAGLADLLNYLGVPNGI
jgi:hypothetical protein